MITLRGVFASRFLAGSLLLAAARLVSMVSAFIAVSIAVRALDETSFGFWSALISLTTLTAGLDLGIGNVTRNRITTLLQAGDEAGAAEAFAAAVVFVGAVSAALVTVVLGGSAVLHGMGVIVWSGDQQWAMVVAVLLLGLFQVGNLGQLALLGREQPAAVALVEVLRWAIVVPGLLLVALAGGGLVPMTAAYFLALAVGALATFPLLWATPAWRRSLPRPRGAWRAARRDLAPGTGFAALQLTSTLVYQTDVLIVAQWTSLSVVGDFTLVQRLYLVPLSLLFAAAIPLWSRTSAEVARGNPGWARVLAPRIAGVVAIGFALGGLVMVAMGPFAVDVWADRSIEDRWLYAGFTAWLSVAGWVAVLSMVLNGVGWVWPQVRWLAFAFVVKLGGAWLLLGEGGSAVLPWIAACSLLPLAVSNWRNVRRLGEPLNRLKKELT